MDSHSKTESRIAGITRMAMTENDVVALRLHLQEVLEGDAFKGSPRSGRFLQFIVDEMIAGRFDSLKERVIGVELFGRSPSYDTGTDAIVRVTASDVRKRLTQHYEKCGDDTAVRITVPAGSYIPELVLPNPANLAEPVVETPIEIVSQARPRRSATAQTLIGFSVGVLLTAIIAMLCGVFYSASHVSQQMQPNATNWSPELREIWAPFTSSQRPLTLTFETRLFVDFRTHAIVRVSNLEDIANVESSKTMMDLKRLFKTDQVYEARRYADFSAVSGLFAIGRLLGTTNLSMKAVRSIDMTNEEIHSSNLVLLGKPGAFDAITEKPLSNFNFVFQKDNSIVNLKPLAGEQPDYVRTAVTADSGGLRTRYAILRMTPGSENGQHVLNLISPDSELFEPLALFITDAYYAKNLVEHLRLPSGKLPEAYEVVIRIDERGVKVLQVSYVAHRAIAVPQ